MRLAAPSLHYIPEFLKKQLTYIPDMTSNFSLYFNLLKQITVCIHTSRSHNICNSQKSGLYYTYSVQSIEGKFDRGAGLRCNLRWISISTSPNINTWVSNQKLKPQNKEGILPVATLSIVLYVLRRSRSASDVAPEVAILSSAL